MRLWSIHPVYLDTKGLLAAWREGLLAKKVLEGKTTGYKNHPQLFRFRASGKPLLYIVAFLREILKESMRRGYHFDGSKIGGETIPAGCRIPVTSKQVQYEWEWLKTKLQKRDLGKFRELQRVKRIRTNGIFRRIPGEIESWEIIKPYRRKPS
jgi:hypothetical protein